MACSALRVVVAAVPLAVWALLLAGAQGCATARPAVQFADLPGRLTRGRTVYLTDAAGTRPEAESVRSRPRL